MSKRILDPDFKYVPAIRTDIRKTFARIRRELEATAAEQLEKVIPYAPPTKDRKANQG